MVLCSLGLLGGRRASDCFSSSVSSSLFLAGRSSFKPRYSPTLFCSTLSRGFGGAPATMNIIGKIANKVQGSDDLNHNYASFYELKANDIDGKEVDFSQFKGKVVLVVNVATK